MRHVRGPNESAKKGSRRTPRKRHSQVPELPAVDRDRLVWDPEYRREIVRRLREQSSDKADEGP